MKVLGIDPGIKGGIAYIVGASDAESWQMPVSGSAIDVQRLRSLILEVKPDVAVVERAQPMPRQGSSSGFNYGMHYGQILGVLGCLQVRIDTVSSSVWKRSLGLSSDKDDSIALASRLFPYVDLIPRGCRKPHDGMAEALLIAEYGRRVLRLSEVA